MRVEFHDASLAAYLPTCYDGGAATSERVEDDVALFAAVLYLVAEQADGLHGGVVFTLCRAFPVYNRSLLAVAIP